MKILIRRFEDKDAANVADLIKYTLRTCNSKDYSPEYIEANVKSHTVSFAVSASDVHT